jgi:hypothetical protein
MCRLHDLAVLTHAAPVERIGASASRAAVTPLLWVSNGGDHRAKCRQRPMGDNTTSHAENDKSNSRNCDHGRDRAKDANANGGTFNATLAKLHAGYYDAM